MRFYLVAFVLVLSGCVSNQAVKTIQAGDDDKSCPSLKSELSQLGVKFDGAKDESGITGKNVGLALVFLPGIIVNEARANKNQDSIDARISHLSAINNRKCLGDLSDSERANALTNQLQQLKELYEQRLIDGEEYKSAHQKALERL